MRSVHRFGRAAKGMAVDPAGQCRRGAGNAAIRLALFAVLVGLAMGAEATGQVVAAGDAGGLRLSAGGSGSGYFLQYGERKMLGIDGFVDVDTIRRFGVEAEGRWLRFHQTEDVTATTYMIGPRYHFNAQRFQPYVKGLVGVGKFYFPYGLARGSYLAVAGGGGVDCRLTRRVDLRLADFEYQLWPQFTFGSMSSYGVSSGIRVRIF